FETRPIFISTKASESSSGESESLKIIYDPERRPVIVWRNVNDDLLQEEKQEAKEAIRAGEPNEACVSAQKRLDGSRLVYALEIDPAGLTEEAWAMIDSVEAYLARECDGLIYVVGEGVYDANLTR